MIRPQSLAVYVTPWFREAQNIWSNAGHSLLILTSPNCSQICGNFHSDAPVIIVRLWAASVRAASRRFRVVSGRLLVVPYTDVIIIIVVISKHCDWWFILAWVAYRPKWCHSVWLDVYNFMLLALDMLRALSWTGRRHSHCQSVLN